jgi:2-polyprenyl-3-methyl-5-hydroxy-6-metoxy-1,4-benzoquinol methylase
MHPPYILPIGIAIFKMEGGHNQDFRTIPSLWGRVDGVTALDIGCGQGLYTSEMVRRGASLAVGMDLNKDNLRKAEAASKPLKGIYWVCGDATKLPFREGVFQLVGCVEVLSHLPRNTQRAACCEMARVAVSGASFWVTWHNSARMAFARWLRFRRPLDKYPTNNLDVWPTRPGSAIAMVQEYGVHCNKGVRYLNYHSRFTLNFYTRHPLLAKLLIIAEGILSKLPLLRRLGITFLMMASRSVDRGVCVEPKLEIDGG